nr:hypothetical protein [Tanacetum cinerariifolium]
PSDPLEHVVDEAVYKELDDRLVGAATTASSLVAEQDNGGGPRCQETIGDTTAQTRVKKPEKKQRSRTHKLKRLYKVGLSTRVKSSDDNEDLGEDASKQRRKIHDIDADEDITLMNDKDNEEMFDVNDLRGKEVFVQEDVTDGEVNAASIVITDSAAATITTKKVTLAKELAELKASKPKVKGVFIQEPSESLTTTTTITISLKKTQDKGKAIMIEEPVKLKKKDQIMLDEEVALKLQDELQAEFDKEQILMFDRDFKRVNTFVDYKTELVEGSSKRAGIELEQESSKKQKINDEKETTELKQLVKIMPDEEGVAIDAIPLAVKPPSIVDLKIHKERKKIYYQISRADGSS